MLPKAPTAASGVRKLAIAASFSTRRASSTEASPIQQPSSGLAVAALAATTARAVSVASEPICGA